MKFTTEELNQLNKEIIINLFEFTFKKDEKIRLQLLGDLKLFAKYYHIILKNKKKNNFKNSVIEFILQEKGYNILIQNLYSNLI